MSNRPYDPIIGRVLALDPVINGVMGQDGANRYAYVYNHPTAFIDPSGFDGYLPDFDFDFTPDFSVPTFTVPDLSGYTPDVSAPSMSSGDASFTFSSGGEMSYGGGASYEGESGNWSGAGPASSADAYNQLSASMAAGSYTPSFSSAVDPASGVSGGDPSSDTFAFPGNASKPLNLSVINWDAETAAVASTGRVLDFGLQLATGSSWSEAWDSSGVTAMDIGLNVVAPVIGGTVAGVFGSTAVEGGGLASDAISGARLANQLVYQEAASAFTETGELSVEAIQGATKIIDPGALGNPAIPEGFAKYTTDTFASC